MMCRQGLRLEVVSPPFIWPSTNLIRAHQNLDGLSLFKLVLEKSPAWLRMSVQ